MVLFLLQGSNLESTAARRGRQRFLRTGVYGPVALTTFCKQRPRRNVAAELAKAKKGEKRSD
jgi:hypothetical protein